MLHQECTLVFAVERGRARALSSLGTTESFWGAPPNSPTQQAQAAQLLFGLLPHSGGGSLLSQPAISSLLFYSAKLRGGPDLYAKDGPLLQLP